MERTEGGYKVREVLWQPFSAGRGVTRGDPVLPKLFNIIVDALVRATLQEICVPQEAQHGFWWLAGYHTICFYEDDVQIARQDTIWVQAALTKMVIMFERVGLQMNLNKTKAVVCTPVLIWRKQGSDKA